jgi:hypothetical protein
MSQQFYGNQPHHDHDLAKILQHNDPHPDRDSCFNTRRYSILFPPFLRNTHWHQVLMVSVYALGQWKCVDQAGLGPVSAFMNLLLKYLHLELGIARGTRGAHRPWYAKKGEKKEQKGEEKRLL